MLEVKDRLVQYPNRYKLTNVLTGAELGTFDFTEETGTVAEAGTPIDAELFESIKQDLARVEVQVDDGTHSVSENLAVGGIFFKKI